MIRGAARPGRHTGGQGHLLCNLLEGGSRSASRGAPGTLTPVGFLRIFSEGAAVLQALLLLGWAVTSQRQEAGLTCSRISVVLLGKAALPVRKAAPQSPRQSIRGPDFTIDATMPYLWVFSLLMANFNRIFAPTETQAAHISRLRRRVLEKELRARRPPFFPGHRSLITRANSPALRVELNASQFNQTWQLSDARARGQLATPNDLICPKHLNAVGGRGG